MRTSTRLTVVLDIRIMPAGGAPLLGAPSHSLPLTPAGSYAVTLLAASVATSVLRQKRIRPSAGGTNPVGAEQQSTVKICPLTAFSGRPPSALKRGSRHVPVHVGVGSILPLAHVSLYDTSVRKLFSQRVFQYISLPLANTRCLPALRAASTFARSSPDQYSSWPDDMNTLCA